MFILPTKINCVSVFVFSGTAARADAGDKRAHRVRKHTFRVSTESALSKYYEVISALELFVAMEDYLKSVNIFF
jgi:hypothetical protein